MAPTEGRRESAPNSLRQTTNVSKHSDKKCSAASSGRIPLIVNDAPFEVICSPEENAQVNNQSSKSKIDSEKTVALPKLSVRIANLKKPNKFAPLTIIAVSHGEIVGRTFPNWLKLAFKKSNNQLGYQPYDLNMPSSIPLRPLSHYEVDSPITVHGKMCAALVARGILMAHFKPKMVISSPEMRCVETAWSLWRALHLKDGGICIDNALAEWGEWGPRNAEQVWITSQMWSELKIAINNDYKPMKTHKIGRNETPLDYTNRIQSFIEHLVQTYSSDECILFVGNATVLSVLNDGIYTHPMHIQKENENGEMRLCELRAIRINAPQEVIQLQSPIMPFTRSLHDSLMHR
ncbi:Protein UBASH3A -like protein [Toxocara canis]|uniref:Protein UBASH3A-like protein n=1 Tax=Toxocara canis TaxID=6265 RepID=A0A0B2W1Z0_TOXCA|nr:Protein UBASH3A -like protein [Toxocara canis]